MAAASYSLRIITPQGIAYDGTATHTLLPVEGAGTHSSGYGFVGVLANHAPYLVSSNGGKVTVREPSGVEKIFQVGPGFFEVNQNAAVFLTQSCSAA